MISYIQLLDSRKPVDTSIVHFNRARGDVLKRMVSMFQYRRC